MKQKKLKKRIIALIIGIVSVAIFSFFFIWAVGNNYHLHTYIYTGEKTPIACHVDIADESVIKFEGYHYEKDELILDFQSRGEGSTKVTVKIELVGTDMEGPYREYDFYVNAFGTVFEQTMGDLRFNGVFTIVNAIIAQLAMMELIMLWLFIDYWRKGDFSYSMIACGGISIYVGILLLYVIHYCINRLENSFSYFTGLVTGAGSIMLLLLAPLMLLLSVLLAVSNILLMRHEGYRPVNALGIVFAIVWFIGAMLTVGPYFFPEVTRIPFYEDIIIPLVYVIGYMECMFISTAVCAFFAAKYKPHYDRDYIIILGCAIRGDGTLTPLLQARVDSAVAFEKAQYEKTGRHAVFVPSGGQGPDEVISEGEAMENYLLSIGVPAEQIAREDKSVNTFQNMQFSKQVIDAHAGNPDSAIAFATTNYHVFRGYILVKKNGFEAKGISAKTKLYFFPNAFLREFIGLLVDQKWKHLIFIAVTAVFFTLLSFV